MFLTGSKSGVLVVVRDEEVLAVWFAVAVEKYIVVGDGALGDS